MVVAQLGVNRITGLTAVPCHGSNIVVLVVPPHRKFLMCKEEIGRNAGLGVQMEGLRVTQALATETPSLATGELFPGAIGYTGTWDDRLGSARAE